MLMDNNRGEEITPRCREKKSNNDPKTFWRNGENPFRNATNPWQNEGNFLCDIVNPLRRAVNPFFILVNPFFYVVNPLRAIANPLRTGFIHGFDLFLTLYKITHKHFIV
jgi:hypothetical protein